jgi:hypothetical protein
LRIDAATLPMNRVNTDGSNFAIQFLPCEGLVYTLSAPRRTIGGGNQKIFIILPCQYFDDKEESGMHAGFFPADAPLPRG